MTTPQRFWVLVVFLVTVALLYLLSPILAPFMVGAFLAYLGDPLVNRLRGWNLSRTTAAIIVFSIMMLIFLSLLLFLIPLLSKQITLLISRLPVLIGWIQQVVLPWLSQSLDLDLAFDVANFKTILSENWQQAGNIAANVWKIFSHSGMAILAWIVTILLIPLVTFYLLRDWEQVVNGIRNLLPRRIEPTVVQLTKDCNEVLSAFLRGQLLVMIALIIFYSIGLSLAGLDLALLLGTVAGLLTFIPYMGVIIGIVSSTIAAFVQFHDWIHIGYVLIVFAIGHVIENFILTPWLVGDRIGLHPVAVIFAILAGGHLFGFLGVLLALPVAAIVMVLLRHFKKNYIQSELYG